MARWMGLGFVVFVAGCDRAPSSFAFELGGDITQRVQSAADARGSVDNGGYLALDDAAWGLRMSLGGLGPGSRTLSKGQGELVILSKRSGVILTSDLGASCSVWIDPHESTNGSAVTGWFTCASVGSTSGESVTVQGGRFATFISDAANNPSDASSPFNG